ncbi:unnamed protein product, partial [Choristocarpus tenellus]
DKGWGEQGLQLPAPAKARSGGVCTGEQNQGSQKVERAIPVYPASVALFSSALRSKCFLFPGHGVALVNEDGIRSRDIGGRGCSDKCPSTDAKEEFQQGSTSSRLTVGGRSERRRRPSDHKQSSCLPLPLDQCSRHGHRSMICDKGYSGTGAAGRILGGKIHNTRGKPGQQTDSRIAVGGKVGSGIKVDAVRGKDTAKTRRGRQRGNIKQSEESEAVNWQVQKAQSGRGIAPLTLVMCQCCEKTVPTMNLPLHLLHCQKHSSTSKMSSTSSSSLLLGNRNCSSGYGSGHKKGNGEVGDSDGGHGNNKNRTSLEPQQGLCPTHGIPPKSTEDKIE